MPESIALWAVSDGRLVRVHASDVDREKRLEDWIESNPDVLGERLLVVGRQVRTKYGGIVDLLAVDGDGRGVVIELKRGKTPRDIVAQALDYETWLSELSDADIRDMVSRTADASFNDAFHAKFGTTPPETLNAEQRLMIVATDVDEATTRIVQRLSARYGVDINVVTLGYFNVKGQEMLARTWLVDPAEMDERVEKRQVTNGAMQTSEWTGLWHVNVGVHDDSRVQRNWTDPRRYGFLAAGQGPQWRDQILQLEPGARVYAYLNGAGYVGGGVVTAKAVKAADFVPAGQTKPITELPLESPEWLVNADDDDLADYMVAVRWNKTVDADAGLRVARAIRGSVKKIWSADLAHSLIETFG